MTYGAPDSPEDYDPTINVGHVIAALTDKIELLKEQRDMLDEQVVNLALQIADLRIEVKERENASDHLADSLHGEVRKERQKAGKLEEELQQAGRDVDYWKKLALEHGAALAEMRANPQILVNTEQEQSLRDEIVRLNEENENLRHNMRNIRDNVTRWTNKFV